MIIWGALNPKKTIASGALASLSYAYDIHDDM